MLHILLLDVDVLEDLEDDADSLELPDTSPEEENLTLLAISISFICLS